MVLTLGLVGHESRFALHFSFSYRVTIIIAHTCTMGEDFEPTTLELHYILVMVVLFI